ncbi:hypothetical protein J2Y83_002849 [Pseudomonas marginalis]|uniref:hypothetical protein n=1 Tax=Pseudomonas marginalis TaxID=298 RepID=UPI00209E67BF|nr:hypothetical protein [Pseudomonas marginalis]MCP1506876.1 hypothetical protein [Pseudomonas marginalis]MCP1524380.1 hypothetical protein [Pseudomonas marginalis]MDQ0499793.1 hypothetical protein [Pseudomonas marginalis]
MKEKLLSYLFIASSLVTLGGFPLLDGIPLIYHIDLGVILMAITAAFGWGGAALGAIDIQLLRVGRVMQLPDSSAEG